MFSTVLFGKRSVSGSSFRCWHTESTADLTTNPRARRTNTTTATSITDHRKQYYTSLSLNGNHQSPAPASTSIASRNWHMINIVRNSNKPRVLYTSVNSNVCVSACKCNAYVWVKCISERANERERDREKSLCNVHGINA